MTENTTTHVLSVPAAHTVHHFSPMKTESTQHLIERTYRESGKYQWVRETAINSLEAGATRVEFGIEWQAVKSNRVYRRTIMDDGKGMSPEELVAFFNTFGGGGKPIGGAHENFGVGSKTSLMPWNTYGIVVVSWVDGNGSMIWIQRHPETGEYGLRVEAIEDEEGRQSLEDVCQPYDDDNHGCDWGKIKPDWIKDHGTVIVLLGNSRVDDTVLGAPSRGEEILKGISLYLNQRIWEVPSNAKMYVQELRNDEKAQWPLSYEMATTNPPVGSDQDRRINRRKIRGAKHYVIYEGSSEKIGELDCFGTIDFSDGTVLDWYLWKGDRPQIHAYSSEKGYIAALYRNELYDISDHLSRYRTFGITEKVVRNKLTLILRPKELSEDNTGVYPRQDRNALLIMGGPNVGEPLPFANWGAEFADQMPEAIIKAIKEGRGDVTGTLDDDRWKEKLAARFGHRWMKVQRVLNVIGKLTTDPIGKFNKPLRKKAHKKRTHKHPHRGNFGRNGKRLTGVVPGSSAANEKKLSGGIPTYQYVSGDDIEIGMLAAWKPHDPRYSEGVVLMNKDHPFLSDALEYWQSQFADHLTEQVGEEVMKAYGEIAVAKIAHSEHLRHLIPADLIDGSMRSDAALTMSLLGLIAEEAYIAHRLNKFGRRKQAA